MACDGVAYPVQIQIEMRVQNKSVDVSAEGSFLPGTAATAGDQGAAKAGIFADRHNALHSTPRLSSQVLRMQQLQTQ